ncbi:MAG TPA: DNA-3-methyladenine glycosylase [Clostridiaceae bacterium]
MNLVKLNREFYLRDTLTVSKDLLGKILVCKSEDGVTKGRIVEAEAYIGPGDAASHAYKNLNSSRTAIQFGEGGYAYIYLIYGMYNCMNIVTSTYGRPESVLIRALEPIESIDIMEKRRGTNKLKNLCSGPGKLCQAMGISKSQYGIDLCGDSLYLEYDSLCKEPFQISTSKRINIAYAGEAKDYEWRFCVKDSIYLSVK